MAITTAPPLPSSFSSPSHSPPCLSLPPKQPRLRASCDGCFLAKVKCSKARPVCSRCLAVGLVCRYSPSSRATGRGGHRGRAKGYHQHHPSNQQQHQHRDDLSSCYNSALSGPSFRGHPSSLRHGTTLVASTLSEESYAWLAQGPAATMTNYLDTMDLSGICSTPSTSTSASSVMRTPGGISHPQLINNAAQLGYDGGNPRFLSPPTTWPNHNDMGLATSSLSCCPDLSKNAALSLYPEYPKPSPSTSSSPYPQTLFPHQVHSLDATELPTNESGYYDGWYGPFSSLASITDVPTLVPVVGEEVHVEGLSCSRVL